METYSFIQQALVEEECQLCNKSKSMHVQLFGQTVAFLCARCLNKWDETCRTEFGIEDALIDIKHHQFMQDANFHKTEIEDLLWKSENHIKRAKDLFKFMVEEYRKHWDKDIQHVLKLIELEYDRSTRMHAMFNSYHEAHSVILEELQEYWDEVKLWPKRHNTFNMRKELIECATMCMKTIISMGIVYAKEEENNDSDPSKL